jgi:cell division protein ZapA (FtsZ GTPase activity inhibitor)
MKEVSIKIFGKEYKIEGDEKELESIVKEIETMLDKAAETGKSKGWEEETVKDIAIIQSMIKLISEKRELEQQAQNCLEALQEINFEIEKKFELD